MWYHCNIIAAFELAECSLCFYHCHCLATRGVTVSTPRMRDRAAVGVQVRDETDEAAPDGRLVYTDEYPCDLEPSCCPPGYRVSRPFSSTGCACVDG